MLRIDTILKQQNISTQELASRLGVSPQYISEVVNERKNITISSLSRFAQALHVPIAALFDGYKDEFMIVDQFHCPNCGSTLQVQLVGQSG